MKPDIDQRAKDIGLTPAQVTPAIRVAIWANIVAEQSAIDLAANESRLASAAELAFPPAKC